MRGHHFIVHIQFRLRIANTITQEKDTDQQNNKRKLLPTLIWVNSAGRYVNKTLSGIFYKVNTGQNFQKLNHLTGRPEKASRKAFKTKERMEIYKLIIQ